MNTDNKSYTKPAMECMDFRSPIYQSPIYQFPF